MTDTELHELSTQVAEMNESLIALKEQVASNAKLGVQVRELLEVLREQKAPQVSVALPAAQPPMVTVTASAAGDMEMVHHWEGNRIVRSSITRKGA